MLRTLSRSVCAARRKWQLPACTAGVSALEFAIIAPVFIALATGSFKVGLAMTQYLALTNAAAQGALTFALSRGSSTPYASTSTAITNAAPVLASGSITKTLTVNGTACADNAACVTALTAGATATVRVTYPCDLTIMGVNFKSGCTLSAQSAQMVQ